MKSQIPRMTRQELYNLIEEALMDLTNMDRVPGNILYQFMPHLEETRNAEVAYISSYIVHNAQGCE